MATQSEKITYSVDEFVADVKDIIGQQSTGTRALDAIGSNLRRLVIEGGDLTKQGVEAESNVGLPGRWLHRVPGGDFQLSVSYFPPDEPTPVHSHNRWGVECVIDGEERFTVWERIDDQGGAGKAELKVVSDGIMTRGDVRAWYDPPKNVHRQWAQGDKPVCLALLMGGDGSRQHIFDLDKGTYEDAPARPS
jgi:hypothetical protein